MSLYFDAAKGVFRINLTKNGTRIRKALPKGTTEATAREVHTQILNDLHRISNRTGEIPGWHDSLPAAFRKRGWALDMLARMNRRAKALGRQSILSAEDLMFIAKRSAGRCEVTGIPFSDARTNGRRPFFQSIDRIDCSRGYRFDNCRLVCLAVNLAMSNWGEHVVRQMAVGLVINQFSPPWLEGCKPIVDSCTPHGRLATVRTLKSEVTT